MQFIAILVTICSMAFVAQTAPVPNEAMTIPMPNINIPNVDGMINNALQGTPLQGSQSNLNDHVANTVRQSLNGAGIGN